MFSTNPLHQVSLPMLISSSKFLYSFGIASLPNIKICEAGSIYFFLALSITMVFSTVLEPGILRT